MSAHLGSLTALHSSCCVSSLRHTHSIFQALHAHTTDNGFLGCISIRDDQICSKQKQGSASKSRASVWCRYVRMDFTWEISGHISAVTHFQAIPDVTLSFDSTRIAQTTLAAFVLLVLLTCTQACLVGFAIWHRLTRATSLWKVFLVSSNP